ncbi:MAG: 3-hydroxyacyl-[acyl-carrier-protein] dehydratase FabA [Alphaproteobacteria bacterium]|nr:3-hydroxyacyl-[acyl-carrier-protein] dehydratase FabA [Alphaproteobacteria bacterium]
MGKYKNAFNYEELLECAQGKLFGAANGRLPKPPMLMFDRIVDIDEAGGKYGKGFLAAELDIKPDLWFFDCHFFDDPVMPGCLGLDAMWQLLGFYMAWAGYAGRGRALGGGGVQFKGEVLPDTKLVRYEVDIKRIINRSLIMGIGEARLIADGEVIYEAEGLRVGLFGAS